MKKIKNIFNHKLMEDNISSQDVKILTNFIKTKPIFTNNKKVVEFEKAWSNWLGIKYSVFVNSGSSANLLSIAYLKNKFKEGEIIVPTLTWSSDIASVFHNNLKPVFVDINLKNLAMSIEEIKKKTNKKTIAIFLTHILGINGLTDELIKFCKKKKIILIEDCCESHGAKFKSKKIGTYGFISNFSFYFAHHMTTIEGGMISTNSREVYEMCRMLRSHGLVRETKSIRIKNFYEKKYKDLNAQFIFSLPAYNVRSTEINAVLGLNQLKNLNKNIIQRNKNFKLFLGKLDKKKYFTEFDLKGQSNYAFIIILEKKFRNNLFRDKFEKTLKKNKIEFRRGTSGGGNQMRQPYVRNIMNFKEHDFKKFPTTEIVHHYGYYIGNYPSLKKYKILKIVNILNNL
jgi:CDP-4-dehydro-6-deoxyglucose reductase, E1